MEKEKEVKTALGALREMYNAIAIGLMEDYTMSQERVLRICESAYFQTAKSHIAAVVGVKPEEISDYEFHRLLDGHYTEDKGYEPIPDEELAEAYNKINGSPSISQEELDIRSAAIENATNSDALKENMEKLKWDIVARLQDSYERDMSCYICPDERPSSNRKVGNDSQLSPQSQTPNEKVAMMEDYGNNMTPVEAGRAPLHR